MSLDSSQLTNCLSYKHMLPAWRISSSWLLSQAMNINLIIIAFSILLSSLSSIYCFPNPAFIDQAYSKMIIKARIQDRDGRLFYPSDSLGLRYLIQFEADKLAPDDSDTKAGRICMSKKTMPITPASKESEQMKNPHIKDVDCVLQRPRAVLSSPDNDDLIGKMNKKALKRGSTPKMETSGRVRLGRVDVDHARIKVRDISPTFDKQTRPKIRDGYSRCSILKDKPCVTKQK